MRGVKGKKPPRTPDQSYYRVSPEVRPKKNWTGKDRRDTTRLYQLGYPETKFRGQDSNLHFRGLQSNVISSASSPRIQIADKIEAT